MRALWEYNVMYQGSRNGASNVFHVQRAISNFKLDLLNPWLSSEQQKQPDGSVAPATSANVKEEKAK